METDLSPSDFSLSSVSFKKTRDFCTGYQSDRFETADSSYPDNLQPWQLPDPVSKRSRSNSEDLRAIGEWVKAKRAAEEKYNKVHVNIRAPPWRVG